MCKISVIMTVKNGERDIRECLNSVLHQSFGDFEFLIFDDHSTDTTVNIISNFPDSRIKLFTDSRGYVGNLNRGISLSQGKYIAKMDHDDIMDHEKFRIQYEVMEHNDVDVCATWIYHFGEGVPEPYIQGNISGFINNPLQYLSYGNNISHPSVMMRKEFLEKNGIRYQDYFPADDYKLWFDIARKGGKFYMVPQPLLSYRLSLYQSGTVLVQEQRQKGALVQKEIREYLQTNRPA